MVEIMATLLVVTVGLIGLGGMQLQANRSIQDSGNRSQAIWVMDDLMNRIRANGLNAPAYDTNGGIVDCAVEATQCADSHDGAARVASNGACTNATLAEFDLIDVACASSAAVEGSVFTRGKPIDQLANPELTVVVDTFGLNASGYEVTITLAWDVRTSGTDTDGNQVYISNAINSATNQSTITTRRSTITRVFNP